MKKYFVVFVALLLLLSFLVVKHNYNNNHIINYDLYTMHRRFRDTVSYDNEIDGIDASEILEEVLTGFYTWDKLLLTDNFKNKYKNRKKVVKEIDSIERLYAEMRELNGRNVIKACLDKKQNIVEKFLFNPVTVEYFFEYKMDADKLDDIKLIKKRYVNSTTADIIKEFAMTKWQ